MKASTESAEPGKLRRGFHRGVLGKVEPSARESTELAADVGQRQAATQTSRKFFGGDSGSSYASFDPAKELGVQERSSARCYTVIEHSS